MFLSLSRYFIFSKMFAISLCVPKLEHLTNFISSESNYLENDVINIPRQNIDILRTGVTSQELTKKNCTGYDYDATKCKYVNNRIICGYNKNIGDFSNDEDVIDMGNGCRMRGDRIECGYQVGPFINLRRPPAHDNIKEHFTEQTDRKKTTNEIIHLQFTETNKVIENTKPSSKQVIINHSTTKKTIKPVIETLMKKQMTISNTLKHANTKPTTLFSTIVKILTYKTNDFNPTSVPFEITPQTTKRTVTESMSSKKKPISKCLEKGDRLICYDF